MNNILLKKISKAVVKEITNSETKKKEMDMHNKYADKYDSGIEDSTKFARQELRRLTDLWLKDKSEFNKYVEKQFKNPNAKKRILDALNDDITKLEGDNMNPAWSAFPDFAMDSKKYDDHMKAREELKSKIENALSNNKQDNPQASKDSKEDAKVTDSDNDGVSDEVEKQEKTDPNDPKDQPDMYDVSNKEIYRLSQAFSEFKENFYQVKQLRLQGSMIRNLMKVLKDIQDGQKKDQAQPFEKVQESINEQAIPKKALENIKTDIRALYQKILSTKKLMNAAAGAADKGKANFRFLRKELLDELEQVQEYILEVYNDLASLNPQQVNEQSEKLKQIKLDSENVQAVYNDVLKKVGPIVDIISKGGKVSERQLIPVVDEILQRLEKIADLFPSVKTFAGQTGEFWELRAEYAKAIRTMSALNDNFQNIIKDESISSVSARELYRGMQKFSSEIERLFGVQSKIEDKPAPEVAVVSDEEGESPEAEDTGSDGEDNDGDGQIDEPDEQEQQTTKEPKNFNSVNLASEWVRSKYLPIEEFLDIFKKNNDVKQAAEKVYDAFLTFLALSKFKQEVDEQEEQSLPRKSYDTIVRLTSAIFKMPESVVQDALDDMIASYRKKAIELQEFYAIIDNNELRQLARLLKRKEKQFPFSVSDIDKRMFVRNFLKGDEVEPEEKGEETPQQAQDAEAEEQGEEPSSKRINKKQFKSKLKTIKNQAKKMGTSFNREKATIVLRDFLSTQNFKIFESQGTMVRTFRDLEKALIDGKAIEANEYSTKITKLIVDMLKEFGASFQSPKEPQKKDEKQKILEQYMAKEVEVTGTDYTIGIFDINFKPAALVAITETDEPCLPNTYMIKYVAVDDSLQGKGFGSYLYDIAAAKAQEIGGNNAGITSDRKDSTTKGANMIWQRIEKKYKAKESEQGNKKFDYDGNKTPKDPDDDCTIPAGGNPATDYSWIVPDELKSRALKIYRAQTTLYKQNEKNAPENIDDQLVGWFSSVYSKGAEKGIVENKLVTKLASLVRNIMRGQNG
jgi:GNAT superfamily N-acetyltransferase